MEKAEAFTVGTILVNIGLAGWGIGKLIGYREHRGEWKCYFEKLFWEDETVYGGCTAVDGCGTSQRYLRIATEDEIKKYEHLWKSQK